MEIFGIQKPKINSVGGLVVAQTYGTTPEDPIWKGTFSVNTAGTITFTDTKITSEIRLKFGEYYIENYEDVQDDDYVEFSIIDKDDILGLFSQYGLSKENGDILELKKFVVHDHIVSHKKYDGTYGAFSVTQGLYFRIAYTSTGTANIKMKSTLMWYE